MSFNSASNGREFLAGHFLLDDEECLRVTKTIPANHSQVVTNADGTKYVPAGAVFPANNSTAVGIVYEDTDVTSGAMPGSVIVKGVVVEAKLPAAVDSDAKSALTNIIFASESSVIRPDYPTSLIALTVTSSAGTNVGDTAITVSGYTKKASESYKYKVASTNAPAVSAGEILDATWTAWDGDDDITAATDKKITVAVVNAFGEAIAAGNATVTAKANG